MKLMPATHCLSGQSLAEEGVWVLRSAHTSYLFQLLTNLATETDNGELPL